MTRLIGLSGYARAGKDVLAAEFVKQGWVRWNFGDVIKKLFDPFTQGDESLYAFGQRMQRLLNPGEETRIRFEAFVQSTLMPYAVRMVSIDAFTEDDEQKQLIRPLLEHGGDLVYDWVELTYFQELDDLLLDGKRVINTRLCRTREAKLWQERDGIVALVERKDWPPSTDWDRDVVEDLKDGGLIDMTVYNNAATGEDWALHCQAIAQSFGSGHFGKAA